MKVLDSIKEGELVVTLSQENDSFVVRGNYPVMIIDIPELFYIYRSYAIYEAALNEFLVIQDYFGEFLTYKNKMCL